MLKFLAHALPSLQPSKLYLNLPDYLMPPGESLHPGRLLTIEDKCLYIMELTVGLEITLEHNAERKEIKYRPLLQHFQNTYRKIKFTNLSTSSFGIFGKTSVQRIMECLTAPRGFWPFYWGLNLRRSRKFLIW